MMDEKNKKCCNRLKELLLHLLENDRDVKEKISDIASSSSANVKADPTVTVPDEKSDKNIEKSKADLKAQIEKLQQENSDLQKRLKDEESAKDKALEKLADELTASTNKIKEIEENRQDLEQELQRCQDELKTTKKDLAGATEKLRATSELEEKYKLYKTLPDNLRRSLAGIVNGESFASFLISGSQESRRENFWEFCRTEVQKSNGLTYAETLKTLFVFFHNNAMSITSAPMYELYEPSIQSRYSGDAMIPSNSGEQSGHVVQVVLPGIRGIKSGNIVKKAIVRLED